MGECSCGVVLSMSVTTDSDYGWVFQSAKGVEAASCRKVGRQTRQGQTGTHNNITDYLNVYMVERDAYNSRLDGVLTRAPPEQGLHILFLILRRQASCC